MQIILCSSSWCFLFLFHLVLTAIGSDNMHKVLVRIESKLRVGQRNLVQNLQNGNSLNGHNFWTRSFPQLFFDLFGPWNLKLDKNFHHTPSFCFLLTFFQVLKCLSLFQKYIFSKKLCILLADRYKCAFFYFFWFPQFIVNFWK